MTALGSRDNRWRLCRGPWAITTAGSGGGWLKAGALPARRPARPGPASVSGCALQGAPGRDRPRFLAAAVPAGPGRQRPVTPGPAAAGRGLRRHRDRPWCWAPREAICRGTQNGHGRARAAGRGRDRRCDGRDCWVSPGVGRPHLRERVPTGPSGLHTASFGGPQPGPGAPRGGGVGAVRPGQEPPPRGAAQGVASTSNVCLSCFRLRKLLAVNENEYFTELQVKEEAL